LLILVIPPFLPSLRLSAAQLLSSYFLRLHPIKGQNGNLVSICKCQVHVSVVSTPTVWVLVKQVLVALLGEQSLVPLYREY